MERKLLLQPARPGLRQLLRLENPERGHPRQGTLPEHFGPLKQTGLVDHGHRLFVVLSAVIPTDPAIHARVLPLVAKIHVEGRPSLVVDLLGDALDHLIAGLGPQIVEGRLYHVGDFQTVLEQTLIGQPLHLHSSL